MFDEQAELLPRGPAMDLRKREFDTSLDQFGVDRSSFFKRHWMPAGIALRPALTAGIELRPFDEAILGIRGHRAHFRTLDMIIHA